MVGCGACGGCGVRYELLEFCLEGGKRLNEELDPCREISRDFLCRSLDPPLVICL